MQGVTLLLLPPLLPFCPSFPPLHPRPSRCRLAAACGCVRRPWMPAAAPCPGLCGSVGRPPAAGRSASTESSESSSLQVEETFYNPLLRVQRWTGNGGVGGGWGEVWSQTPANSNHSHCRDTSFVVWLTWTQVLCINIPPDIFETKKMNHLADEGLAWFPVVVAHAIWTVTQFYCSCTCTKNRTCKFIVPTCAVPVISSLSWSATLCRASVGSFSQGSSKPGPSGQTWKTTKQTKSIQLKAKVQGGFHGSVECFGGVASDQTAGCRWRCTPGLCAGLLPDWAGLQHCWSPSPPAAPKPAHTRRPTRRRVKSQCGLLKIQTS